MKRVLLLAVFVALVGFWGLWYLGGSTPQSLTTQPNLISVEEESGPVATWAPEDKNENGQFDWEEELLLTAKDEELGSADKNAVATVRFALTKKQAPLIPAEAIAFTTHTRYDLNQIKRVESDNPLILSGYVVDLRKIMSVFNNPGVGYEVTLTNQAVELGATANASQIAALSTRYNNAVEKLLALEAPVAAAQIHLNLINALTQLGESTALMSQVSVEPMVALGAAQTHENKLRFLIATINSINIYFLPQGLAYQNEAPLLSFDI